MVSVSIPPVFIRRALPALLAALAATGALAQAAPQTIVITGNPLGRAPGAQPVSVLSGESLLLRRAGTLGETLDGLPGVAGTGFGPNSNRPVIRGLDGDRVRLLDNGGASIDASNLSFDHASATDPLIAERIEVLRGPAALLYGGNATGGVVNTIDNRIPRVPASGLSGRAEVRLGGAASERAGAAVLEGGGGGLAWHADVFGRQSDDLRVPRFTPVEDGEPLDATQRVRNSAARSVGGAVGAGWASEQGYLGASVETVDSRYGLTIEPEVYIRMNRDRLSLAGERRGLAGPFVRLSAQASHTRYEHDEMEGGEVHTHFESRGNDLRVEAQHAPLAGFNGVIGLQAETLRFSALGEEAFVPGTRTRSAAVFALEEFRAGPALLSAGLRHERVNVDSDGDAIGGEARFGSAQQRRFSPTSLSFGLQLGGNQGWQMHASLGHTERAPAYYELYASGLHVATGAYERGDPTLEVERSRHAELAAGWSRGAHMFKASVYQTRFSRFISLDATGNEIEVPGHEHEEAGEQGHEHEHEHAHVPEYAFRSVRARFSGLELEGRTRLLEGPLALDLSGAFDLVRGDNLDSGEALPRLSPRRTRVSLEAVLAGWRTGIGLRHAAAQDRVPRTDSATPGYTMLDLWASGALKLGNHGQWFVRLANATDRLARNASTIETMRGLSPLPGRALTVGLRAGF